KDEAGRLLGLQHADPGAQRTTDDRDRLVPASAPL
ncbi:MAG: hypothetical protein AVDCRST_MAG65-1769, partial [uncultured Solirubrobacteraceae bacterium]